MKRITGLIVAMMMVLTLVPCSSFATERTISISESYVNPVYQDIISEADLKKLKDTGISMYSRSRYFTEETEVIDALREAMTSRQENITIKYLLPEEIPNGYLDRWMEQAYAETGNPKQGDYLRWHLAGATSVGSGFIDENGYNYTFDITVTYYTTAEQEEVVDQTVANLIMKLGISDTMSDYEKLCAIYDYVCETVTYDHKNLYDNAYTLKFSAYAAIIDKTAVCQGYSNLMYRLMNEVGVKCRIIAGEAGEPHGWNIVKLGAKYYLVDATWDAPNKVNGIPYEYFAKGTEEFAKDHTANAEYMTNEFKRSYPISETDYSVCDHTEEVIPAIDATCTATGLTAGVKCTVCGEILTAQEVIPVKGHEYGEWIVNSQPTCETRGQKYRTCTYENCKMKQVEDIPATGHTYQYTGTNPTCTKEGVKKGKCHCGKETTEYTAALGHDWSEWEVIEEPKCSVNGKKARVCKRENCGKQEELPIEALEHSFVSYTKVISAADVDSDGEKGVFTYCEKCGNKDNATVTERIPIYAVSSIKLSYGNATYNGKTKAPSVKVTDRKGNVLVKNEDYTVTYASGRKNVGKYKVTIALKGDDYTGKVYKYFKINPKGVSVSKLTKGKKSLKVTWKKPTSNYRKQMSGYQIRYSTKSSMASAKTVTVKSTTATSKTIKKLKAKKKYYVQIRTYKTVSGTKYYSAWSSKKSVTTK